MNQLHEFVKSFRCETMAFIHDNGVPILGTALGNQASCTHAIDGREYVVVALQVGTICEQFAEGVIAEHFTVSPSSLS